MHPFECQRSAAWSTAMTGGTGLTQAIRSVEGAVPEFQSQLAWQAEVRGERGLR